MEDEKLRELSEDFLKKNVIGFTHNNYGIIIHEFKNGRVRKIDLFKRFVQIIDYVVFAHFCCHNPQPYSSIHITTHSQLLHNTKIMCTICYHI